MGVSALGLYGRLLCVWCEAVVVRRLSLAWWAGFLGLGLLLVVCLRGEACCWLGLAWGGVRWRSSSFWAVCLGLPRVV